MKNISFPGLFFVYFVASVASAEAQDVYQNVNRFFSNNTYGTIALALGVRNSSDLDRAQGYQVLVDGESTAISQDTSYCVVFQHYGGDRPGREVTYTVRMYAVTESEPNKTLIDPGYSKPFKIASSISRKMPNYCFKRGQRTQVWLETTSNDRDWFDGVYHLTFR